MVDNDKLFAAWAHFPIFLGTLVPILVWFMHKEKNKDVAFQAKQALAWQVLGVVITIATGLIGMVLMFLLAAAGAAEITALLFSLGFLLLFAFIAVYLILAIIAAIKVLQGKEFYYPVIGKMLK